MESLLAICSRQPGNELISAECENLTGGRPDPNGIARCQTLARIERAAFLRAGVRLVAEAETFDSLLAAIAKARFEADDFRIEILPGFIDPPMRKKDAIISVANAIPAKPNLHAPRHRFLLAAGQPGFWLGEIMAVPDHSYRQHERRPYRTTSSLPSQLARALVNLVAPPARTIFDPCCGTGSILLQAQALGLEACGTDRNPRMVGMARLNLAHFGFPARVALADAAQATFRADAIVADLPYGLCLDLETENIRDIIKRSFYLAPVAVFVASSDLSGWLESAGYRTIEVFRVKKHGAFTRYVHRARAELTQTPGP